MFKVSKVTLKQKIKEIIWRIWTAFDQSSSKKMVNISLEVECNPIRNGIANSKIDFLVLNIK